MIYIAQFLAAYGGEGAYTNQNDPGAGAGTSSAGGGGASFGQKKFERAASGR
jgi:hypothetical protein